jgi:hypothetical protein
MSITRLLAVTATAALFTTPALASGPPADHGHGHGHQASPETTVAPSAGDDATPGPDASAKTKARAYGKACQGQSKKHVKGEKGTAFSRCVTAMAKAATDDSTTPREACAGLSKKHVKGEKGTAFSRCVKAAAKIQAQQQDDQPSGDDEAGTAGDAPATT